MAGKKTEYEIALLVGGKVQSSFGSSIKNVENGINSLNNMAHTAAAAITAAFATVQVGQFVEGAVSTYSSFEQAMATTAATAKASQADYERLEEAALAMGKATTKTATESAEALGYMALAGWDVDTSIAALEPVLRLSEATQMDLARSSDLVTDSMSALGLSVDSLGEYLDVCTAANNNANTTAEALMEAFIGCGGAAKTVGADMIDMATALGVLANNGTKGAEAGTALNSMLVRISSKDTAIKAMKELGVSAFDASGNFIGLNEVLVQLSDAMANLTTEQQTAYMSDIAGTNYYTEMSYLLNSVKESADGTASAWDTLSTSLENSDGALMDMAATVTDTLSTSFQILNSATEDAQIHLVDAFGDDLKGVVLNLAEFIPTVTEDFIRFADKSELKISKVFGTIQKGASKAWNVLTGLGEGFLENYDTIENVIVGIGTAFVSYKVISYLIEGASAVYGFGQALMAMSPSNLAVFGITAAATAIVGVTAAIKNAEKQAANNDLAEHFGNIALSLEDVSEVAEYIVSSDNLNKIQESLDAFGELDGIRSSMEKSIKDINKKNWKISIGLELSEDEKEAYIADVENYISQANEYFIQERYAANINFSAFDDGSVERQNIISELNSFYDDVYTELQGAGKSLSNAVNAGFEDNLLDIDESEAIIRAQEAMARVMDKLATSEFDAKLEIMGRKFSGENLDAESFQALQEELEAQVETARKGYEEAWQHNLANAKAALDNGSITQEHYNTAADEFYSDYLSNVTEVELKAHNFQLDTIGQVYGEEFEKFNSHTAEVLEKYQGEDYRDALNNRTEQVMLSIMEDTWDSGIPQETKQALSSLLGAMETSTAEIQKLEQQWKEAGLEAPTEITQSLARTNAYGAMTVYQNKWGLEQSGDTQALYDYLLQTIVENDEFAETESILRGNGWVLPITEDIKGLYAFGSDYLEELFSQGFDVSADVNINLNPVINGNFLDALGKTTTFGSAPDNIVQDIKLQNTVRENTDKWYNSKPYDPADNDKFLDTRRITAFESAPEKVIQDIQFQNSIKDNADKWNGSKLPGHADGGIFNVPHVAWFAEEGPEAAIPLDGSSNAISLWQKVGMLLGVLDGGMTKSRGSELYNEISSYETTNNTTNESSESKQFVFSPKITIEGNASREDVDSALSLSMEQFRDMMEQYIAERNRVSFS